MDLGSGFAAGAGVRAVALIVAAGRGERLGGGLPKQYLPLAGRPLLRHALERFARHPRIAGVRAVIGAGQAEPYGWAAAGLGLLPPVEGGLSRQASCLLGLESLEAHAREVAFALRCLGIHE